MDENIIIENMRTAYTIVNEGVNDLDNKSFQMLSIIGVMFTVQVSLLSSMVKGIGLIMFLLSLIIYFISIIFFLKPCLLKKYYLYPTNVSEVYHYECDVSYDEYVAGALGDYDEAIKNNVDLMIVKSSSVKFGFYSFVLGLILTFITVCCVCFL